ncbi:MAG: hypothetical protein SGJ00_09055 [bacterium]|nr:hypothetical protein [bacterium]
MKNQQIKTPYVLLLLCLMAIGHSGISQNQKVWSGTSKLFGINAASNSGSSVNWSIGNAGSSSSSKLDSSIAGRAIFSRFSWANGSVSMVVDSVKVNETVSGCIGSTTTKLVEVYPAPTITLPSSSQVLCSGVAPANFDASLTNYGAISGIGTFLLNYEIRKDSASGSLFASGIISGINSGTVTINTGAWPSMNAGTSYYFVITQFGSEQSSAGNNPSPGNISTAAITGLPQTYSITINPTITPPSIQAY